MNAFTIGGQEVLIQGENLGTTNTSILLYYGNYLDESSNDFS